MKRFVSRPFATLATVAFGIVTFAVAAFAPALAQTPAADFGSPPSGEVPILFNDQHVYSKPDRLKKARVLAALVRGKTILVPLRSLFEQTGATVSYNASTKTVDVSKPGADVQVTVGKPEVVINGESRPLDVPPEIYRGSLVVPLRVIAEGMGAYVQWVPDRRLVVVRYIAIAPTAPPTEAPTAPPTPVPTAAPSPTPVPAKPVSAHFYLAGDALFDSTAYNEFSPGNKGGVSEGGRVGATVDVDNLSFMAEGDFQQYRYPHRSSTAVNPLTGVGYNSGSPCDGVGNDALPADSGCVTALGPGAGNTYVPSFVARDTDIDGRVGIGIASPRIYLVASYLERYGNYGYPRLTGVGGGLQKLSNFDQPIDVYGSVIYYPQISGGYNLVFPDGTVNGENLQYRLLHYQAGLTIGVPKTPVFLDFGYVGDHGTAKENAPSDFTENSLYGGIGVHF